MLRLKFTNHGDEGWSWVIYTEKEGVVLLTSPAYETFAQAEAMCVHFLMHVGVMPAQYAQIIMGDLNRSLPEEEVPDAREV